MQGVNVIGGIGGSDSLGHNIVGGSGYNTVTDIFYHTFG